MDGQQDSFRIVSRDELLAHGATINYPDTDSGYSQPEDQLSDQLLTPHEVAGLTDEELSRIILAKQHGLIADAGNGQQPARPMAQRRVPMLPPPGLPPRPNPPALPPASGSRLPVALHNAESGMVEYEDEIPEIRRRSRVVYAGIAAAAVLFTGLGVKAMMPNDTQAAAHNVKGPAATARPTAGAETSASQEPSASPSESAPVSSSSASASQSPMSALPAVPLDAKFELPDCTNINIKFVNDSTLPLEWPFMGDKKAGIEPDPNIAPGKLAGKLVLKSCLIDKDAIQLDKKASKRVDHAVFTVDLTKTRTTLDENHLRSGIAVQKSISTDEGLLAAIQAINPDATLNDVKVFNAQLAENQSQVKTTTLLTALKWYNRWFAQPSLDVIQEHTLQSLKQQVADRGYDPESVTFVDDITVNQKNKFKLSIDKPEPGELTGQFVPRRDLAEFHVLVTRADTGEQLQPEEKQ